MELVLVRHATCALMDGVLLGRSVDRPLDERGEGQARFIANRLMTVPDLVVESSPRRRARHTAGIIAARRDTIVRIVPQMDEIDFGSWSGRTFATLAEDPHWRRWNRYRAVSLTPAGDCIREVQKRALAHFQYLETHSKERTVVIVTHAEVIRSLVLLASGAAIDDYSRVEIAPASMTMLNVRGPELQLASINEQVAA